MNFILLHDLKNRPYLLSLDTIVGFALSEDGSHTLLAIVNDPDHKPCREKFDDIKAALQAHAASFIVPRSSNV